MEINFGDFTSLFLIFVVSIVVVIRSYQLTPIGKYGIYTGQNYEPSAQSYKTVYEMISQRKPPLIPYQHCTPSKNLSNPCFPPRSPEEIQQLGMTYFPDEKKENSFLLAMAIYDWTTIDFARINPLNLIDFSGQVLYDIIWDFITTFLHSDDPCSIYDLPCDTTKEIFENKFPQLQEWNSAETEVLTYALDILPKLDVEKYPAIYRGGLEYEREELFCPQFKKFQDLHPKELNSVKECMDFMFPSSSSQKEEEEEKNFFEITCFWSFTIYEEEAVIFDKGILFTSFPKGHFSEEEDYKKEWNKPKKIQPFSIVRDTGEVLFPPNSSFELYFYTFNETTSHYHLYVCEEYC